MTQTTLSVDDTRGVIAALNRRFSDIEGPEFRDICYATQNRQSAVRELSRVCDDIIVVGAPNSSNSNRLREIGEEAGLPSYLVVDGGDIKAEWGQERARRRRHCGRVGAQEILVDDVVQALMRIEPSEVLKNLEGLKESVSFRLPAELSS